MIEVETNGEALYIYWYKRNISISLLWNEIYSKHFRLAEYTYIYIHFRGKMCVITKDGALETEAKKGRALKN